MSFVGRWLFVFFVVCCLLCLGCCFVGPFVSVVVRFGLFVVCWVLGVVFWFLFNVCCLSVVVHCE